MPTKRGYSRDFTPRAGTTGARYLLDDIPRGLWLQVRRKANRDGLSIRALLLQLLTRWLDEPSPPPTS